ncbi:hypothetical protein GCM10010172_33830 [Paractinoplanes ferrugineus]|uniref:PatA-like N-terminal domain-containing protein n=1 Tax=Paractinoplanes ferrugineus TaxID=113564 RepID=A0A919MCG5_9ACTN|nr:DUF4388 domain-containing protein [Actinoplanes ferrugineus]GIE14686.1 hypothetical protein Afe05nite_65260 [Actinoplanes ferrugineus]
MTATKTAGPARLLTQVAADRQTGALVVGGHPGGAVYVLEGRVIYAESPAAPGVGELLTASGRLAGRTWQTAIDQGTSTARVGRLLVEQGHLTQGELELCVLGATYDAAYFALSPTGAPVEFLDGAMHWLGPVAHIDPAAVNREVRRRTRMLDSIFPDARVDTAAVTPVARPPRERITLTALQWELLVHADGQRTPADLALLLGRAGFATIAELRRLAAAGLLELPEVRAEPPEFVRLPVARGAAVDVRRPPPATGDPPPAPPVPSVPPVPPAPSVPPVPVVRGPRPEDNSSAGPVNSTGAGTVYRPPRLARRKPGAKLPKEVAGEAPPAHPGTDEVLLKRIRTALRALR